MKNLKIIEGMWDKKTKKKEFDFKNPKKTRKTKKLAGETEMKEKNVKKKEELV